MRVRCNFDGEGLVFRVYSKNRKDKTCYARRKVNNGLMKDAKQELQIIIAELQQEADRAFVKAHIGQRYTSLGEDF